MKAYMLHIKSNGLNKDSLLFIRDNNVEIYLVNGWHLLASITNNDKEELSVKTRFEIAKIGQLQSVIPIILN